MRKVAFVVMVLTVFGLLPSLHVFGQDKPVRIGGAGLLSDVVETFVQSFKKEAATCSITISGATTGIGFQKLLDGDAEIAMVTRPITSEETKKAETKGISLNSKLIGQVSLAVITNAKNTVNELTMDQLAKIFRGDLTNWSQVGGPTEPIKVTIRAVPETGAGLLFQEKVLAGAPYAKDAVVMSSYNTTVMVCGKSYAIGYIPTTTTFFDTMGERGVKVLKIKKDANFPPYQLPVGVARETQYPIAVPFYLYWNTKIDNPCVKRFVDFSEKQTQ
jgi:phosphate transport system substrate-binding protein